MTYGYCDKIWSDLDERFDQKLSIIITVSMVVFIWFISLDSSKTVDSRIDL